MPVVSNTSPISNLAIIGHLDLIREQLGSIIIPPGVRSELQRHPDGAARTAIEKAITDGWLCVKPIAGKVPGELAENLDLGEAEALTLTLTLAIELKASLVLLDESSARQHAGSLGLSFTGVLGILRHAKQTGRIASLSDPIARLRKQARFFIGPALEKALLTSVGEISRERN